MSERIAKSTAIRVMLKGYLSSDHVSDATGLDPAVLISKAGAAFANPNAGATVATEISNGWYYVDLDTTDTDTLGPLLIRATHATMDAIEREYRVAPQHNLGIDALPDSVDGLGVVNDATNGNAAIKTATNLAERYAATYDGTVNSANQLVLRAGYGAGLYRMLTRDSDGYVWHAGGFWNPAADPRTTFAGMMAAQPDGTYRANLTGLPAGTYTDTAYCGAGVLPAGEDRVVAVRPLVWDGEYEITAASLVQASTNTLSIISESVWDTYARALTIADDLTALAAVVSGLALEASVQATLAAVNAAGGTGAVTYTHTVYRPGSTTLTIPGVSVWLTTDAGGTNTAYGPLTTDTFGTVTFHVDAGSYFIWAELSGWNFPNPTVATVIG